MQIVTLKNEVEITGNGLMKNKPCRVVLKPSNEGKIRYFVKDYAPFEASVDNVISTDHCVTLGSGRAHAVLEEHLSAALALSEINSVDIYTDNDEIPILDGSSKIWCELFKSAGIDKPLLYKPDYYTVKEPVFYLNGKTSLVIIPESELFISYAVNYDHKDLKNRWVNIDFNHLDEIRDARTFGYYKELKKYQMLGFAHGVTRDNTVGMLDDGGYTTELRSEYEPVKHKILDLIGDFYLTGVNPLHMKAQILVKEAGHAVHIKAAKVLKDKLIKL
ncbi:UDP-3-O-acyl-N-acetylglucosamine deacetylase [bacterium]|nr:UDP-3-O-acyl-N-acetylglucosamine deacetylase [bacterium]